MMNGIMNGWGFFSGMDLTLAGQMLLIRKGRGRGRESTS
jgi:hypothetical protein